MISPVGLSLMGGLILKRTASAGRLALSSSFSRITTWSPPSSTETSVRHTFAPAATADTTATEAAVALPRQRSAISLGKPWLVLPTPALEQHQGRGADGCGRGVANNNHFIGLLDIESGTSVPVPVPRDAEEELLKWRWIGSSQGWLILGDPETNLLCLCSPDSTRSSSKCVIRISLPDVYPRKLPTRVFLTSPLPSSSSHSVSAKCQVFAMYESCIAFCSLDADSNSLSMPWKLLANWNWHDGPYQDFLLDGRCLFTVAFDEYEDYVEEWNLHGNRGPEVRFFDFCDYLYRTSTVDEDEDEAGQDKDRDEDEGGQDKDGDELDSCVKQKHYLLRWSPPAGQPLEGKDEYDDDKREVLLVKRYVHVTEDGTSVGVGKHDFPQEMFDKPCHRTVRFDVYRSGPFGLYGYKFERLKSLEDQALFLGYNQSSTIPVAAVEGGLIKGNCIYFTDDYEGEDGNCLGGHDCGVFDMADQTIQPLHQCGFTELRAGARPFWLFTPSQP